MKAMRTPQIFVLGAVGVLALAACSSSGSSASSSGSGTAGQSALICEVDDFTGSQGVLTVTSAAGAQVAAQMVNAAGGIKSLGGAKIVIQDFDTQSNPNMGVPEANKAVAAGCKAVFGGEITDTVMPATAVTHRAGIPWVDIGGIGDAVHERGYNNVFQLITSTGLAQAFQNMMLQVASEFHLANPTIGLSISDTTYGHDTYAAWANLNKNGPFKVVSSVSYLLGTTDLTSVATHMVTQSPDILFNIGYPPDGIALVPLFKQTYRTTAKAFVSTAESAVAMSQLGSAANGLLFSADNPPGSNASLTAFNTAYQAKTGQPPSIEAWQGYLAMMFIAHALQKAGSTSGPAIASALHQVQLDSSNGNIYPGTLAFASNGVMNNQTFFWQQDQNGKLLYVYPSGLSQASLISYGGRGLQG